MVCIDGKHTKCVGQFIGNGEDCSQRMSMINQLVTVGINVKDIFPQIFKEFDYFLLLKF